MTKRERELRAKITALITKADAIADDDSKAEELTVLTAELEMLNVQLEPFTVMNTVKKAIAPEMSAAIQEEKTFANAGEFFIAVARAKQGKGVDPRLQNVVTDGQNTTVGADGGYLIQKDWGGQLMDSVMHSNRVLELVRKFPISANSNGITWWRGSTAEADSVAVAWTNEGGEIDFSKQQFEQVESNLQKLTGAAKVTSEMLEDASFLENYLTMKFQQKISRKLITSIINGTGTSQPKGFLKSGALITVPKQASQVAKTILTQNIYDMYFSAPANKRAQYVWIMHPDCAKVLPTLKFKEETGSAPAYLPAYGISGKPYNMLLGLEIAEDDACPAIGEAGCFNLVNLSEYMLLSKGNIKQDWSAHVEFMTDSMVFRIVYRVNGLPTMELPIDVANSTSKVSPYITLAKTNA